MPAVSERSPRSGSSRGPLAPARGDEDGFVAQLKRPPELVDRIADRRQQPLAPPWRQQLMVTVRVQMLEPGRGLVGLAPREAATLRRPESAAVGDPGERRRGPRSGRAERNGVLRELGFETRI